MKNIVQKIFFILLCSSLAFASVYKYDYNVTSSSAPNWSEHDELFHGDFKEIIRFSPIYFDDGTIDEDSTKTVEKIKNTLKDLNNSDIIVTVIGYAEEGNDKPDQKRIDSRVYGEKIVKFFTPSTSTKESLDNSKEYVKTVIEQLDEVYPKDKIITEARGDKELRFTTESYSSKEKSNRVMVAIYVKNPPLVDSDKDGVYDKYDLCPHTESGVKVDTNGCALDLDKDGVLDYKDECPHSLVGAFVNEKGCSIAKSDSDGDGVLDIHDQCPNTPKGTKVNDLGCVIVKKFIVHFDTSLSNVKSQFHKTLDEAAAFMKKYPTYKAKIIGHTDARGTLQSNMILSKHRALAVKKELIKRGIAANRLKIVAKGPKEPIATNKTAAGRRENRRTEIELY